MRYLLLLVVLLEIGCKTASPIAADLPRSSNLLPELSAAQWDTLRRSMQYLPDESQLALALVEGSEVTFAGQRRLRGQIHVVENETKVFEIGSITKGFTTHLIWENRNGKPTAYWDLGALQGAGGMLSSMTDLAKYAQWCLKEFNADFQVMQRPTVDVEADMAVTLGWHIIKKEEAPSFLWHNGGTGGFKASLALDPARRKAVIILSNVAGSRNPRAKYIDRLCFALMQLADK